VDRGDRPKAKNIIVLLTDGLTNSNARETAKQLHATHSTGTYILPIGVNMAETAELAALASDENGVFVADSFPRVSGVVPDVVKYLLEGEWPCCKVSRPDRWDVFPLLGRLSIPLCIGDIGKFVHKVVKRY